MAVLFDRGISGFLEHLYYKKFWKRCHLLALTGHASDDACPNLLVFFTLPKLISTIYFRMWEGLTMSSKTSSTNVFI